MSKREVAYDLATRDGWIVGIVTEDEPGYTPTTYGPYDTQAEAKAIADHINTARGIDRMAVLDVVMSSMRLGEPVMGSNNPNR